ncbi:PepSY-like domain-containing protein [bacterium]|nr:PepSY-like domain-containing protein [bacterium]
MKTVQNFAWIGIVALMVFAFSLPVYSRKVAKKDIPAAITSAFTTSYPNAVIKKVSKEKEDSRVLYEVESTNGEFSLDIVYSADGTALEIEEGIPQEDLTAPVKAAVQKAYPKGKITKAEKLTRGNRSGYEITVAVGKKVRALALDANGNALKSNEEDEKAEQEEGRK